jgi:hypothetical protein
MDPQDFIARLLQGQGLNLAVESEPGYSVPRVSGDLTVPIRPDLDAELRGSYLRDPYGTQPDMSLMFGLKKRF